MTGRFDIATLIGLLAGFGLLTLAILLGDQTWILMTFGPISSGVKMPRPPPSTIAGPPMPILVLRVAITTSQQPTRAALPAKQRPETIAIIGTRPESRPKWWNVFWPTKPP